MRITNTEQFIKKSNEIHGGKYDYSLVQYVKSNQKVRIICPIHGEFEQTPNVHLCGRGCRQCGRNATKTGFDKFVENAHNIHGNKYDYSHVVYTNNTTKVVIVCPVHGNFEQTPHGHVTNKQGCPKCAALSGGLKRRGDNNPMRDDNVKRKVRETNLKRYGAKTYAESEQGRQSLRAIISSDAVQKKMIATCMSRYGARTWSQSDIGRFSLHQLMSSESMQAIIKQGYGATYGVDHYMKTAEGRNKFCYEKSVCQTVDLLQLRGIP